jgi:hypothetical protein
MVYDGGREMLLAKLISGLSLLGGIVCAGLALRARASTAP